MRRSLPRSARLLPAVAGLLVATPLVAQTGRTTPNAHASIVDVTPYAGVIMFGNYLDGPLGTNVRSRPAPIGGAQISLGIAPNLSLTGNVGYSRGDLEVGLPIIGGLDVGSSDSWVYDAGIEYRLPASSTLTPFVQVGAGAITTKLSGGPITTSSTNFAGNIGGGVDLAFGRSTALRVGVRDYIAKWRSEEVLGVRASGDVSHNFAVSAGLRFAF
jgi:hypothetical protein